MSENGFRKSKPYFSEVPKKTWRDRISEFNFARIFSVLGIAIAIPFFVYFWKFEEESLFMSASLAFMAVWGVGLAGFLSIAVTLGVLAVLLEFMQPIRKPLKKLLDPIISWFKH